VCERRLLPRSSGEDSSSFVAQRERERERERQGLLARRVDEDSTILVALIRRKERGVRRVEDARRRNVLM
jgi:hypothetical protein